MNVCRVEDEVDLVHLAPSPAGDFAAQRQNALEFLDGILEIRAKGRPAADLRADYASVTKAYEVVRAGFADATTPDEYLAGVQEAALAAFGSSAEVDRFLAAYTAWVVANCGFDPQLGIQLFPS